jgi:hypothetical protein
MGGHGGYSEPERLVRAAGDRIGRGRPAGMMSSRPLQIGMVSHQDGKVQRNMRRLERHGRERQR